MDDLKKLLDNIIAGNEEQSRIVFHNYLSNKMKTLTTDKTKYPLTENVKDEARETALAFRTAIVKVKDMIDQKAFRVKFAEAKRKFDAVGNKGGPEATEKLNNALFDMRQIVGLCGQPNITNKNAIW